MNIYKQLIVGALVAGLVGYSAWASAGDGYYGDYDYAPVTEVIPVYEDVQVRRPRTECWDEQLAYKQPRSAAGAVIGGLIGAAIGNKVGRHGHHHGRRYYHRGNRGAATVAGAAVGALVGNEVSRANAPTRYTTRQRCQLVDEYTTRRDLIGYDVRYRYNGREYMTRTDRDPGDRIRVRVDVSPAW